VLGDPHRERPIADRPVQRLEIVPHDLVQLCGASHNCTNVESSVMCSGGDEQP
jgi:hypothetical protein